MRKVKHIKLKITYEKGTTWITVNGDAWKRNGYPEECVDTFGDVWLKPWYSTSKLYVPATGSIKDQKTIFVDKDGYLEKQD